MNLNSTHSADVTATSKSHERDTVDWTVKYHPTSFSQVAGNRKAKAVFQEYIKQGDMPHLLLYGHRGTGKNTMVKLLAKGMLGSGWKAGYNEMNASDKRRIDVVRKKILAYMRKQGLGAFRGDVRVPFKILYLNEADAMTSAAQEALKRPLELYKRNCRVVFDCNNVEKIIPQLQGRATKFEFTRLSQRAIKQRLRYIMEQEGVKQDIDLDHICRRANGSMRDAIGELQKDVMAKGIEANKTMQMINTELERDGGVNFNPDKAKRFIEMHDGDTRRAASMMQNLGIQVTAEQLEQVVADETV